MNTTDAVKKTNVTKTGRAGANRITNVRSMVQIAMLAAVATVLMLIEFPMPFIAPPFYKMDFSEVPVLIGAFAMGPLAGAAIEFIKILLNFVLNGTVTAGVGELGNLIVGCALVVPAGIIYRRSKTRKHAVIGMGLGAVCMTAAGCVVNGLILLPAYATAFGMSMDAFVEMGSAIIPAINSVFTFCIFCVAPFNLLKGIVVSVITLLLYKYISRLLKGNQA
jgi:riboflavin transporter FmnP